MSKRYPGGVIRQTPDTPTQASATGVWNMTDVTQAQQTNNWPVANVPNPMSRSLRFRSSASAYMNRTPATASNRKTWTWSAWVKLGEIAASNGTVFAAGTTSGESSRFYLRYTGSQFQTGYGSQNLDTTVAVYRDPSAWYHLVLAVDTTQATAANRLKIYMNGVQQSVTTSVNFTQNVDTAVNNTVTQSIGRDHIIPGGYFDGYLSEVNFVDGQQLAPTAFGQYDQFSNWTSKQYTGTYGTNGFYLPFKNNSSTGTLGLDYSGNNNTWTTNNFSVTAGTTYDSMTDVPTQWTPYNVTGDVGGIIRGNYATFNPLDKVLSPTVINGNLSATVGDNTEVRGTIYVSSGKWYWEVIPTTMTYSMIGIGIGGTGLHWNSTGVSYYGFNGNKYVNGTPSAYGASYTNNDVIGVALDLDNLQITFYKNGTSQGTITGITAGLYVPALSAAGNSSVYNINFGQYAFTYAPPSGYKSLCTTNLPTPTIQQGNLVMDATLYTGNGTSQNVVNTAGFKPDLVWGKNRSNVANHGLVDSVRGVSTWLGSNSTAAENTVADSYVTAFNSNGFTAGLGGVFNASGDSYVGWQWQAGQGTTSSNTSGSITSTVSVNPTAGFSVVTYTGTGSNATIGHGLGIAPSMLIIKARNVASRGWMVGNTNLNDWNNLLQLSDASGYVTDSTVFNGTAPTSSVFSIGTNSQSGANGTNYVAYCWSEIAGFSKFGSYVGNGSTDGAFVYTGFRPKYIMWKRSSGTGDWLIQDTSRSPYNLSDSILYANYADAESNGGGYGIDILSNGFKFRNSATYANANGSTYIYMAFAEYPFKSALGR